MEFFNFKTKLNNHIQNMITNVNSLYEVDIDKDKLWELYLDSFPKGTNEVYRERRYYDCSACRHFIKLFGSVVSIKNGTITTIWDLKINDSTFDSVIKVLSDFVKAGKIKDFFLSKESKIGVDKNYEQKESGEVHTWEHMYTELPDRFVIKSSDTIASIIGQKRDIRNVFKRSLAEISEDAINMVLELIAQNSLYRGEEWEAVLKSFLKYHKEYHKLDELKKEIFCWEKSSEAGAVIGKIKNHSIGLLLTDITQDIDLNEAVRKYEAIVAPTNYKRPKSIFTKKMLEDAKKKLEELGLLDSLPRRFASLDDIRINNILFANRDAVKRIVDKDVFKEMETGIAINPRSFDKIEEIGIDTFIADVLPKVQSVEILFENHLASNMVSLIAPINLNSPTLFKWDNGFSWAYSGNIADSMKERVKSAGGKIDGVLRFSIQWNEEKGNNQNDLDAHCIEPNGNEIFYARKNDRLSTGMLDVDIINPGKEIAVENITWSDERRMYEGEYLFFVHNFSNRGGKNGFTAEIEFAGQIYSFVYNKDMRQNENVNVAKVIYNRKTGFKIIELLPSTTSSKKVWNLDTNQFHPVLTVMYSPNYWDEQKGIGNRHYFFMLKDCINNESPNGFFNEYLKENLLSQKHVFEALGSKMRVEDIKDQLSGIGFSSTKRNSLICKVTGSISRAVKIKF